MGNAIELILFQSSIDHFILKIKNSGSDFDQLIQYRTFVLIFFPRVRNPRRMELDFTDRK